MLSPSLTLTCKSNTKNQGPHHVILMQITRLPTYRADGSTVVPEKQCCDGSTRIQTQNSFVRGVWINNVFTFKQMHYALNLNMFLVKRTGNQRASMPVRKTRRFIPPSAATAHGLEDAYSTSNNFEEMLLLSTCASGPLPDDTSNNSNKLSKEVWVRNFRVTKF